MEEQNNIAVEFANSELAGRKLNNTEYGGDFYAKHLSARVNIHIDMHNAQKLYDAIGTLLSIHKHGEAIVKNKRRGYSKCS